MARIRTIKPEFHAHEDLSSLPAETHLLAAALINYADDEGYFNANPVLVKAGTNPLRNDKTKIEDQLSQLEEIGYIEIRRSGVRQFGRVINFDEHQRVSHPTPSKLKSKFEELPKSSGEIPEPLRPEGKGREQGIEGKQEPSRGKREADSRHSPFRKVLEGYWRTHNQHEMPWSGGEGKAMAELLAANPAMNETEFRRLLGNRHKSTVNHAERPRAWLAILTNYGNGPLDRFGKPLEAAESARGKPHDPGIYQGDKTDDAWVNDWRIRNGMPPLEVQ